MTIYYTQDLAYVSKIDRTQFFSSAEAAREYDESILEEMFGESFMADLRTGDPNTRNHRAIQLASQIAVDALLSRKQEAA